MTILDMKYRELLDEVLHYGMGRTSRVGDTLSLPGRSLMAARVQEEFPIITSRKIYHKGIIGELAAFLKGATKLQDFKDFGCNYWDHNAKQWWLNEGVLPEHMTVGKIYGAQWRRWGRTGLDQLYQLVQGIEADPYGRRHILTTWNPEELDQGCLPPCHLLAQFYVSNSDLDCIVYMRSVDLALGLPSDLVLYGALLVLVANHVDLAPGRLHFHFGDAHIYKAHIPAVQMQLRRTERRPCPKAILNEHANLFDFHPEHFMLENYQPMEAIQYELFF